MKYSLLYKFYELYLASPTVEGKNFVRIEVKELYSRTVCSVGVDKNEMDGLRYDRSARY